MATNFKLGAMFSVEYFNKTVIITAYNIRRINFRYQSKLRKLIVQAMKQSCDKLVLNFAGVRLIDNCALEMLKLSFGIAQNLGVKLSLLNLDEELVRLIHTDAEEIISCLPTLQEKEAFSEMLA